jgi:hypothetical protein
MCPKNVSIHSTIALTHFSRAKRCVGQDQAVSDESTPERRRGDAHDTLVGTAVSELAVRHVDRSPPLGDLQDRGELMTEVLRRSG